MGKSVFPESARRQAQRGFTLVELLVALAIASVLAVAILAAMAFSVGRDTQQGQIAQMNEQARAALALITRDVQSAGFLATSMQGNCTVSYAYDSQQSPPYVQQAPISAASQVAASNLPLQSTPPAYPPATQSSYLAQSILMLSAPAASTFFQQSAAPIYVVQFGTTQSASGQGSVASTQLPVNTLMLNSVAGIQPGDMMQVQVPMNGGVACFRAPVCSVNATGSGASYIDSKSCTAGQQYMPSNGYKDYAAQVPSSMGSLSNSNMQHAKLVDFGQANNTLQYTQYWISQQSPYTTPTLMRSVYSVLTDNLIASQAIAPGVQSLQILFGTVPAGSTVGSTAPTWKSWGNVLPTDTVVSVDVALVLRTLQDDPAYTAPSQITIAQPATGLSSPDAFMPVPTSGLQHRHFQVYTMQIAMRNTLWNP